LTVAVRQVTRLVDDLDGSVAAETVRFGIDGDSYELDLSAANAADLRGLLRRYAAAGRRVGASPAGRSRLAAGPAGSAQAVRSVRAAQSALAGPLGSSAPPAPAPAAPAAEASPAPAAVPPAAAPAAGPGRAAPAAPSRPLVEWAEPPSAEPDAQPVPAGRPEIAGVRFSDQPAAT
jgi:hypothetical protein